MGFARQVCTVPRLAQVSSAIVQLPCHAQPMVASHDIGPLVCCRLHMRSCVQSIKQVVTSSYAAALAPLVIGRYSLMHAALSMQLLHAAFKRLYCDWQSASASHACANTPQTPSHLSGPLDAETFMHPAHHMHVPDVLAFIQSSYALARQHGESVCWHRPLVHWHPRCSWHTSMLYDSTSHVFSVEHALRHEQPAVPLHGTGPAAFSAEHVSPPLFGGLLTTEHPVHHMHSRPSRSVVLAHVVSSYT